MTPLDLSIQPPRSPYEKLEGLFVLPRTIDKLRAKLPGGNIGTYTIRGSTTLLPGFSLVLLEGLRITEERLLEVVRSVSSESEIARWLRENVDMSEAETLNAKLAGRRISDVLSVVPLETIARVYPFLEERPKTLAMFDVLLEDDRRMFPDRGNASESTA